MASLCTRAVGLREGGDRTKELALQDPICPSGKAEKAENEVGCVCGEGLNTGSH